jgi:hypothetical protein
MVSIFAETVYDETVTLNLTDFQRFENNVNFNYPAVSADTIIGGFVYIERIIVELNFIPGLDVKNTTGTDRDLRLDSEIEYDYDGTIDLFSTVGTLRYFDININPNETPTLTSVSDTKNFDNYLDVPGNVSPKNFVWDDQNDIRVDGDQTVDAQITITLVGRKP